MMRIPIDISSIFGSGSIIIGFHQNRAATDQWIDRFSKLEGSGTVLSSAFDVHTNEVLWDGIGELVGPSWIHRSIIPLKGQNIIVDYFRGICLISFLSRTEIDEHALLMVLHYIHNGKKAAAVAIGFELDVSHDQVEVWLEKGLPEDGLNSGPMAIILISGVNPMRLSRYDFGSIQLNKVERAVEFILDRILQILAGAGMHR
ncbi:MAG: hypothetical protein JST66_04435 [Bacteroidetes bacterium]|nr:hypothetical protein [Bacteroidota bacterium]